MRLSNNQIGRLQLLVAGMSQAVGVLNATTWTTAETQEERATRYLQDLLMTAEGWSDLDQIADELKTLYNTGCPVTLTPERS